MVKNNILTVFPELMKDWDWEKNKEIGLNPENLTKGSGKKAYWICKKGHKYFQRIAHHLEVGKCPVCCNQVILTRYNDLQTLNPELAKEWHPTKNGELLPNVVSANAHKKVWWLGKCGHEWQAIVYSRKAGTGCPYCSNQKVLVGYNDLATIEPKIAEEWHPEKNVIKPTEITSCSNRKVWWLGKCGHEWQSYLPNRVKGVGCPICSNELKTSFGEQAIFYYLSKVFSDVINRNQEFGFEIDVYIPSLELGIEYDGQYFHNDVERDLKKDQKASNKKITFLRIREPKCPKLNSSSTCIIMEKNNDFALENAIHQIIEYINKNFKRNIKIEVNIERDRTKIYEELELMRKENSLEEKWPNLMLEWHPIKNGSVNPSTISVGSDKKIWWLGKCGHEWQASVVNRVNAKRGCPYCSGQKVLIGFNDFETWCNKNNREDLLKEWNYEKNIKVTPKSITKGSSKSKIFWKCQKCNNEWYTSVTNRVNGTGCPKCSTKIAHRKVNDDRIRISGSLYENYPEVAKEWHKTQNGDLTPKDVMGRSHKKVWWICKYGHIWEAKVASRTEGHGCPYCSGLKVINGKTDLKTLFPEVAEEWDYKKNGDLLPNDVTAFTHKNVYWKCLKCKNGWKGKVSDRTKGGHNCPICAKSRRVDSLINNLINKNGSLEDNYPKIAKEWDYKKNKDLSPSEFMGKSNKKVWWICNFGHSYKTTINRRTTAYDKTGKGSKCPYCSNRKLLKGYNDFKTWCHYNQSYNLLNEWDTERNSAQGIEIDNIIFGSHKEIYWRNKEKGTWKQRLDLRIQTEKKKLKNR